LSVFPLLGSIASQSMHKSNCVELSTRRLNIQSLVNYERKEFPTKAIMFIDTRGIKTCVSPDQKWVQFAIKKIDQKRTTK
ncbi:XCL1 protein, partial [Aramus guarauna]|nr:XCL1 protein [Aramus guarauna]